MKDIIKYILLIFLTCFSFFYTDRVMNLINQKDPLMKVIEDVKNEYKVEAVNAIIEDNTIIPGIKGKKVNVDSSYEEMKLDGIFRESSLVYDDLLPSSGLFNNKDKYIIKGSSVRNSVALIFIIDSENDINIAAKNKNLTLFIDSKYITTYNIKKLKNNEIYSYGNNGTYNKENIISDNMVINRFASNKSSYCLTKEKSSDTLDNCNKNDMFVVIPNIVGGYLEVKNNLSSGSIILLDSLSNIDIITRYINSKGYDIVYLSSLLKE